ncbi:MAG: DUF2807 domain-containing protein [Bacteroidia bacterium]|nr:DUF2807 domain-containing protein [Bacteroidia bacterium]
MRQKIICLALLVFGVIISSIEAQKDIRYIDDMNQERILDDFTGITVNGNFNIFIYQASANEKCSALIEAHPSIHKKIKTEVKNGMLNIYYSNPNDKRYIADIYLILRDLKSVKTYGNVDIETVTNIEIKEIEISLSEKSGLWLYLTSPELYCSRIKHSQVVDAITVADPKYKTKESLFKNSEVCFYVKRNY